MTTIKSIRGGATAVILAASCLLTAPASNAARPTPHTGFDAEDVAECLAPLAGHKRSPDVYEGWIDGCRARAAE